MHCCNKLSRINNGSSEQQKCLPSGKTRLSHYDRDDEGPGIVGIVGGGGDAGDGGVPKLSVGPSPGMGARRSLY